MKNLLNPYKGLPKEIYILFVGKIVNSIGAFVHPLMSLILTQRIGMSASEAGQFITILAVFQVPCMIVGGKLADSIGRRKVIIGFQLLGAATFIICGLIPISTLTAKMMILSACFYSVSSPAYDALNADLTDESNRKEAYSLLYMGANIGYAIGPILGGFLYKNYLPLIFIGDAITTLIALFLFIKYVGETKKKVIKNEQEEIEFENSKVSTFKVFLQRPILILFPLMMLLFQLVYSQWGFSLPLQMGELFGDEGAKLYGFLGAFNAIIVITCTPLLTSKTRKYNPLNVMAIGGLGYGLCFLIYGYSKVMTLFFIGTLSLTIGEILIAINNSAFIANNTPSSHRGRISSIIPILTGAGYALGPMIMGRIIDLNGMYISCIIIAIISVIGSVGMFSLNKLKNVNNSY
ncbi:MFS transporter [[Clostridium] dakarense]|uniref:MFS transporter n=1 Tax=Faecalimicrobium dakarense TaxID=1301100 RepID=UPI0004BC4767|nr:MFS transporter [[Clostridium] dakarense]